MNKQNLLFYLCTTILNLGLLSSVCIADSVAPRRPVFTSSDNGLYLFKMVPKDRSQKKRFFSKAVNNHGIAYRVETNGNLKELWRVKGWFAWKVFLSNDGEHLVRMGPWCFGNEPKKEDLAVAFYKKDTLLKKYSTADLVENKSAVFTTVSHYSWLAMTEYAVTLTPNNVFSIRTIDNIQYEFDITTGKIISKNNRNKPAQKPQDDSQNKNTPPPVYHLDGPYQLSIPEGYTRLRYSYGKPNGGEHKTYFTIHDVRTRDLLASPAWTPYNKEPIPLDVSKIAKIAKTHWKNYLESYGEFKINSIELCTPSHYDGDDPTRWFYEVKFSMPINSIIVLLDATVVPAKIVDLKKTEEEQIIPSKH